MPRVLVVVACTMLTVVVDSHAMATAQVPEAWVISRTGTHGQGTQLFAVLLDHRGELGLLDMQLERIEDIGRELRQQNEPLMVYLRDAAVFGVEREEERAALAEMREKFRANTEAAERDVEEVLTVEQRERTRSLLHGGSLAYGVADLDDFMASGGVSRGAEPDSTSVGSVRVRVENLNYHDATIYAYRGVQRYRVGFVTGLSTRTLTLPTSLVSGPTGLFFQVQLLTRPRPLRTNEVTVSPGNEVLVRIPPS